ncbi:hypothetical protein BP5796_03075 [Coleophoma crateriformis]|uniref:BZIP domain-containing protein n=1 Tax=Coleophoma crateriformis TaxID=565419 RepID=A0A3D8SMG7_9HELO|nr:hypothetical protein BP5796_03075 [Coleophoma crateriformis]
MTVTKDHSQGYFPNVNDPSFILDSTMNNGQDLGFPIFSDNMQDLSNFDFSILSSYGGAERTGFTPGLDHDHYDFSFEPQASNNSDIIDLQLNPYLAQAATTDIDLSILQNTKTSQLKTCNSNNAGESAEDIRKRGGATTEDNQARTDATNPLRVKKRRNRKPKHLSAQDIQQKREKFLNRNRLAASKCRTKKKASTHKLEDRLREFQAERKDMEYVVCELMAEIDKYTELLQSHAGCDNQAINTWLAARAIAIIRETSRHNERPTVSPSSSASTSNDSLPFSGESTRDESENHAVSRSKTMESVQHFPEGGPESLVSLGHSSPTVPWMRNRHDSSLFLLDKAGSPRRTDALCVDGDNEIQYVDSVHQDSGVSDIGSPD